MKFLIYFDLLCLFFILLIICVLFVLSSGLRCLCFEVMAHNQCFWVFPLGSLTEMTDVLNPIPPFNGWRFNPHLFQIDVVTFHLFSLKKNYCIYFFYFIFYFLEK